MVDEYVMVVEWQTNLTQYRSIPRFMQPHSAGSMFLLQLYTSCRLGPYKVHPRDKIKHIGAEAFVFLSRCRLVAQA